MLLYEELYFSASSSIAPQASLFLKASVLNMNMLMSSSWQLLEAGFTSPCLALCLLYSENAA